MRTMASETEVESLFESYQRLKKCYFIRPYKVSIKSKVEKFSEKNSALPYTLV